MQHKWHKEIKAWADGAEIEQKYIGSATTTYKDYIDWNKTNYPNWDITSWEFRIKPQPKEPQYLYVYIEPSGKYTFGRFNCSYNGAKPIGKIKLEVDDE